MVAVKGDADHEGDDEKCGNHYPFVDVLVASADGGNRRHDDGKGDGADNESPDYIPQKMNSQVDAGVGNHDDHERAER